MGNKGVKILLLLLLLYISAVSNYINDDYYSNAATLGLINFLICSFIMMFFPIIFRLCSEEAIEYKKARKICLWNLQNEVEYIIT